MKRRDFTADGFRLGDDWRVRFGFALGCATDSAQFGCR